MLQENSIIVSLTIRTWVARKLDKKVTNEVKNIHNASDDAGRYNKLLVSKDYLEGVQKVISSARTFHYENTLPWGDNERLLPAANYFSYTSEMLKLKGDFDKEASDFISTYSNAVDQAKVRLKEMFTESDYPSPFEIAKKFSFENTFMPVPTTDFRVKLQDGEVKKLVHQAEIEISNRLGSAVKDTWNRIKDQLDKMKSRLSDPEAIFRDSLFLNLKELISLLPKLNITNDPNLNTICADLEAIILDNPDTIRNNQNLRKHKADEVNDVLNRFKEFLS